MNAAKLVDPDKGQPRLMVMKGLFRRRGEAWPQRNRAWFPAFVGACMLFVLAPAACGSGSTAALVQRGYAGYEWQVVAIRYNGTEMSIPARLKVGVQFGPGARFGANDSINSYSGTYRATGDGFTSSATDATGVGYAGHDPAVLLAANAMRTFFDTGVHATVKLTGDQLLVRVGFYTLTCQRLGLTPPPPSPLPVSGLGEPVGLLVVAQATARNALHTRTATVAARGIAWTWLPGAGTAASLRPGG